MNKFLKRAMELNESIQCDRQFIHQNAELGNDLPITSGYVKKRLEEYRKTDAYSKKLADMLASSGISGSVEIRLAPEDMKLADSLKKGIKAETEFKADGNIKLGGLAVYFKDKGTVLDKTFDLALEEQREIFTSSNAFVQQ